MRKDSGEFVGQAVMNDNTQTFSKNVGNSEGLHGWSEETTDWQLVAFVIRIPEFGPEFH